jgi:iron(III) transport system ATP-binding protein
MADIQIDQLRLRYGAVEVLKGVSFTANAGSIIALLGASGSGKTTLLRALAGLEQPSAGKIILSGATLYDSEASINLAPEARGLGLVFQSYALWPHKTVAENVGYPLKLRKIGRAELDQRVKDALDGVGLGKLAERYPHQLSGGQQQRVALARALVYAPKVILLDEPLSNLDAKLREEARIWLRRLINERGLSAICVTHDQVEAMALADRILLLNGGRVDQDGSPREIYQKPASLFAAEFMGSNNHLQGRVTHVDGGRVTIDVAGQSFTGRAQQPLTMGQPVVGILRTEKIGLLPATAAEGILAPVIDSLYLGERLEVVCQLGDVLLRAYSQEESEPDRQVRLHIPEEALWVYLAPETSID